MLAAAQIAIQRIGVRHDSPRYVDDALIERMANSLSLAGQLQPISVRRAGKGWVLIFGYLRLHAAKRLGWKTIWAVVHPEIKKQEHVDLVLWAMDNLHHATPELDELAVAVKRMADAGMSDSVIAVALGKTVDWVNGMLEIARNPIARCLIDKGRLVGAEDWLTFMRLSPYERKRLLDSTEPITRQSCEQAQRSADQDRQKKKQPVLQKSFQTSLQSDSTLDLFSQAEMDDGNRSTINHTRTTFDFFNESVTNERQ